MKDHIYDLGDLAQSLVGERLTGVRYFDVPCFGEVIDEWPHPISGVHVVAHGVDLDLERRTVGITWGNQVVPYNLDAVSFSLAQFLLAGRFESVLELEPWSELRGQTITSSELVWTSHSTPSAGETRFPFALVLGFGDSSPLVLAAASLPLESTVAFPGGDDIVVAWRADQVRRVLPEVAEMLDDRNR